MSVNKATRARTSPIRSGPNKGKLPMPDANHARNALARMNQTDPPLSPAEKKKVIAAANRKLGKGKK